MPCYRPVTVFKDPDGGPISFHEKKNHREIQIPCGKCVGCRFEIVDAWAFRCMAEAQLHRNNHFITLTYDDDHLPVDEQLDHREWQLFAKKLRAKHGPFRFFMCGEYGEQTQRPHYHALLFGLDIPDLVKCNSVYAQHDVFESESVGKVWGKGRAVIGSVTHESARYCAGYAQKRVSEELAQERFAWVTRYGEFLVRRQPYGKMSLKPGIGAQWFDKYWMDCANHGAVFQNQYKKKIPRYFCDLMEDLYPDDFERMQFTRTQNALRVFQEGEKHPDRLAAKEQVAIARKKFKERLHAI